MRRTAWLILLCWQLPKANADAARLLPILFARLKIVGRAANDCTRRVPGKLPSRSLLWRGRGPAHLGIVGGELTTHDSADHVLAEAKA